MYLEPKICQGPGIVLRGHGHGSGPCIQGRYWIWIRLPNSRFKSRVFSVISSINKDRGIFRVAYIILQDLSHESVMELAIVDVEGDMQKLV